MREKKSKAQNRADKQAKEANRVKSQQQKTAKTWGIGIPLFRSFWFFPWCFPLSASKRTFHRNSPGQTKSAPEHHEVFSDTLIFI